MNTKTLIVIALCAAVPAMACAQKKGKKAKNEPVVEQAVEETPIVTEDCIMYTSLFHESAKNKQFADAMEPWLSVYNTCPSYSKNVYLDGEKIIEWKLSTLQEGSAEYNEWRTKLMKLHDDRIKYFGDDAKYPTSYILGQKALDFFQYFPEADATEAMKWLRTSIEGQGGNSSPFVVLQLADASLKAYKANPDAHVNQYITDYQICSDAFQATANVARIAYNEVEHKYNALPEGDAGAPKLKAQLDKEEKKLNAALANKTNLDNQFAQSGAADCSLLNQLFEPVVAANTNDLETLQKVMKLYRRIDCVESEVYFAAAEASHKLNPTAESAAGCASMSKKKGEFKEAVEYYDQAAELTDDIEDKAKYLMLAAKIQLEGLKNYPAVRAYAKRSLEYVSNQSSCYILIGLAYASSQPYSKESVGAKANILNKTVFWAAVDKFNKAKQVDPSCANDVQKLISTYSKYFPTKEERFDLPGEFSGSTFTVGGWIGEVTAIR